LARKILVTSGKGGVGKTTVIVNISTQLSTMGYRVLIIDGDFGLNNLDIVMGIENKVIYDIYDIVEGRCRPSQALVSNFYNDNLFILPATRDIRGIGISAHSMLSIVKELEPMFDYILIDSPAGIDKGFVRTLNITKEVIVVTTPHISSLRDADKVCKILRSVGVDIINIVINRVRGDLILNGESVTIDFIKEFLGYDVIGVIPEDDEVNKQLLLGGEIHTNTPVFSSFKKIVKYISYGKLELYDCTKRYKGIIGNIRKRIRRLV